MNHRQTIIAGTVATIVMLAAVAAASSYATREILREDKTVIAPQSSNRPAARPAHLRQMASAEPVAVRTCNDNNIAGTIAGGAAGGIVGSQIGNGNGKTAATIGGVLGGAYLGNQYIPLNNLTCR